MRHAVEVAGAFQHYHAMILFLVAQAIAASPTPNAAPPPPHPRGVFNGLADYPPEAVRNHWEGTVVADLTVSPAGRVSVCKIIKSSGHSILDDATCKLLIDRAVFTPARDANGNPVEDHVQSPPISWHLQN